MATQYIVKIKTNKYSTFSHWNQLICLAVLIIVCNIQERDNFCDCGASFTKTNHRNIYALNNDIIIIIDTTKISQG